MSRWAAPHGDEGPDSLGDDVEPRARCGASRRPPVSDGFVNRPPHRFLRRMTDGRRAGGVRWASKRQRRTVIFARAGAQSRRSS